MSKAIQHALTIANFTIDRPAPLEINRKIATMGGVILIVSKNWPLFVQCLSVFLFSRELRKIRPPTRKKNWRKTLGRTPYIVVKLLNNFSIFVPS